MKRKEKAARRGADTACNLLLGAALGLVYMAGALGRFGPWLLELPTWQYFCCLVGGFFVGAVPALLVQTVLHEGGHLLCGLATGYGFCSFRVGSLLFCRDKADGRLCLRRLRVPGTAGQCLLAPPAPGPDGSFPYRLYHLGGVLANLAAALACVPLTLGCRSYWPAMFWQGMACIGLLMAVQNALPVRLARVNPDGYNLYRMGKSAAARRAVWIQLAYAAALADGAPLAEMPEEWFSTPADAPADQEALAVLSGLLLAARRQEAGDWSGADAVMRALLARPAGPDGLTDLQRDSLLLELDYSALTGPARAAFLEGLGPAGRAALTKCARKNAGLLAGLRVLCAWYTLAAPDPRQAAAWRQRHAAALARYPYPAEVACERAQLARLDAAVAALPDLHP